LVDGVEGLARRLARLDVLGQAGLVVLGQQLVPADVFQVQPDEILIVPFGAVTYSSHGAFPRVGLRSPTGEWRPSTIERRGMRPCSGDLLPEIWGTSTNSLAGGGPSIVHLFGCPTHISGNPAPPSSTASNFCPVR